MWHHWLLLLDTLTAPICDAGETLTKLGGQGGYLPIKDNVLLISNSREIPSEFGAVTIFSSSAQ